MCRDRVKQISHVQENLIVYLHRKDKNGDYTPIGTGFIIDSSGLVMTARHNIDFSLDYSFWALYKGNYHEIKKKHDIDYQYCGVDIMVVQADILTELEPQDFFIVNREKEVSLISQEVLVIGFENSSHKLLATTGVICGIDGGKIEIQNANMGSGNSGAPVLLKKDCRTLIGVMSKREPLVLDLKNHKVKSEKFGIGYAHSINLFYEICKIDVSKESSIIAGLLNTRGIDSWNAYFAKHLKKVMDLISWLNVNRQIRERI